MYTESGGLLKYFVPNVPLATTTAGVQREMDIGAASADHGEYICIKPCKMKSAAFTVVGEAAGGSGTAPTIVFTHRPTPLSATGEVLAATVIVPDGTAIGASVQKSDLDVSFEVGDSLEIAHTIGITGPTGMGFPSGTFSDDPENIANNSGLTETA